MICPLCNNNSVFFFKDLDAINYYHCLNCELIFKSPNNRLNKEDEKAHYDLHNNNPQDLEYRKFLGRLFYPVCQVAPPQGFGLDYGCGPGPTLHLMFEEAGYKMDIYDPFYYPDNLFLKKYYDFITLSEVAEHLHYPMEEFVKLWKILKPNGHLAVMTQFSSKRISLKNWYYKKESDPCLFLL